MMKNILYFLLFVSFVGCNRNLYDGGSNTDDGPNYFGFVTSEIVINVTPETESYRIVVEYTNKALEHPWVNIDRENTTAKHNVHFVNTPEGDSYIGAFTPLLEGNKIYKDVKIMPDEIKERVVIVYYISSFFDAEKEPEGLIKELKVILQPKASTNELI